MVSFSLVLFENLLLNLFIRFLAQTNSVARIPRATGITSKAGPGKTIITRPIANTVNPMTAITTLLTCFKLLIKNAGKAFPHHYPKGSVFSKKKPLPRCLFIAIKVLLIRISPTNGTGLLEADVLTITAVKATPL
jgi:hypothetical protein